MRAKARLLFVDDQNKTLWFYTEVLYFHYTEVVCFQQRAELQIEKIGWLTAVSPVEPRGF